MSHRAAIGPQVRLRSEPAGIVEIGFERMFVRLAAKRAGAEPDEDALRPYPETVMVGPTLFEKLGRR